MGGRPGRDGLASVSFPNSVREVSTEAVEIETPLLYERREIKARLGRGGAVAGRGRRGAGDAGRSGGRRGPASTIVFSGSGGRFTEPPHGVLGGMPGSIARILVDGEPVDPASLGNSPEVHFRGDQTLTVELPGGGGYGDPARRDPRLVEEDLRGGYISRERAIQDYGYDPDDGTSPA